MKKKILITGSSGYVGHPLINKIKKKKFKIIKIDSNLFEKFYKNRNNKNFDIRDLKKRDFENIDTVIHLAAISNDPIGETFKKVTKRVNLDITKKIALFAKQKKVKKFIFASSCSVYGKAGKNIKNEDSKLLPLTEYAKSKIKSEKFLEKLSNKNFQVFSLRFATACGYSDRFRNDLAINDFIFNSIINKKLVLKSDGSSWRPFIHVNDMVKIIIHFLEKKYNGNYHYLNCGMEKNNFKIITIAKKIKKKIPSIKFLFENKKFIDSRSYKVSFKKLNKLTKIKLDYNLDEIIKDLIKNIRKLKKNNKEKNIAFVRLNALNHLINNNVINKNLRY